MRDEDINGVLIPDTLKIGGFDYKIVCNPGNDIEMDDDSLFGCHSSGLRRIGLVSTLHPQMKSAVFIHECLHAVNAVYLNSQIKDENIIKGLESGLHQILEQLGIRFVR